VNEGLDRKKDQWPFPIVGGKEKTQMRTRPISDIPVEKRKEKKKVEVFEGSR